MNLATTGEPLPEIERFRKVEEVRRTTGMMGAVAAAAGLLVGFVGPSWAGTADHNDVSTGWGDTAKFTFTWVDRNTVSGGRLSISDNTCDDLAVYAHVRAFLGNGQELSTSNKYNKSGCRTTSTHRNLGFSNTEGIQKLWIHICHQQKWAKEVCTISKYSAPNPHYRP